MYDDPGLEQRLSRFEAQLDRFSLALHQWQSQEHAPAAGSPDVDQRLRTLEETFGREAQALRQMHEEPLKQLQAQAESLKQICAAASNSVNGLDQAETRLAELQQNVQLLVTDLSRSLQALITDLRAGEVPAVSAQGSAASWPLERVVHLHDELRRAGNGGASSREPLPGQATRSALSLEGAVAGEEEAPSQGAGGRLHGRRWWLVGGGLVLVAALLAVGLVSWIESRLNAAAARVAAAERQVVAATELANREVTTARQEADRQISEARQSAQRAEAVGAILTAPDLIRYNLTSPAADGSSALVSWSRTRGLVLSGSRLPAAPPESTYQLWLVTGTRAVSAGLFVPDAAGQANLVVDAPPRVVGRVVGVSVTIEPGGGRPAPTGQIVLARFP